MPEKAQQLRALLTFCFFTGAPYIFFFNWRALPLLARLTFESFLALLTFQTFFGKKMPWQQKYHVFFFWLVKTWLSTFQTLLAVLAVADTNQSLLADTNQSLLERAAHVARAHMCFCLFFLIYAVLHVRTCCTWSSRDVTYTRRT